MLGWNHWGYQIGEMKQLISKLRNRKHAIDEKKQAIKVQKCLSESFFWFVFFFSSF
jgi:hypothetical protein